MSDQPADQQPSNPTADHEAAPAPDRERRTRVSGRWMRKMVIFLIVCLGLGSWGLYDALMAYPSRGRLHSEFMLADYLTEAGKVGRLAVPRLVSVEDPAKEIMDLEERREQLNELEVRRYRWLNSLRPLHGKSLERLTAENAAMQQRPEDQRTDTTTMFVRPSETSSELTSKLQGRTLPKPLSQTDIAVQWLICLVGYAGALFILFRIVQTRSTVYRYLPAEHRLTLPGGKSITPDQIDVVDKSKWHKFFVALDLKGGESHKFDLLRFEPLEEWILAMEDSDPRLRAMREEAEAEEAAEEAALQESDPLADAGPEDVGTEPDDEPKS